MEALVVHLRYFWAYYAVGAAAAVPIIWLTRKYSIPFLQFVLEFVVYSGIVHIIIHGIVRLAAWFQYESQMKFLEREKVRTGWITPILEVWNRDAYNPKWVFYLELVLALAVLGLMVRYRPMAVQKPLPKREHLTKGKAPKTALDSYKPRQKGKR